MTSVTPSKTVTLRPNGSVTIPKAFRVKHPTPHYLIEEIPGGFVFKPIREEIEYYKKKDGTVGLHFPYGIEAGKLASMFEEAIQTLEKEERMKKPKKPKKSPRRRSHE